MASAPCGSGASDKDSTSWQSTAGNGTNQRSGSSTSCIVTGVAYANHNLDYHCYTRVSSTETWTYLRNDATNVYGWIRDDKLSDGGSFNAC
ncbi:SH3 domain-containing protein [Streptomyces albipurpureus]|uniref:SH3 domain-containing protein n=1 Tax=Streptomyces albipurpureus TaxID=2897419 RepID=A0ABT0UYJ2_9ACTN|nr:SH3 domain-containing protein [Streptomyces sp. CWNU-1]MCM2393336.1 SH3 domain-containing protein [Streptomyces sp. CWNU-1]